MACQALTEKFEFYSIRFVTSVFYEGEDVLRKYYGIRRITENTGEDIYFKEIYKWVKSCLLYTSKEKEYEWGRVETISDVSGGSSQYAGKNSCISK